MGTFLFDKTIFGPVKSRRLGVSLGINLLPNTRKICNFNCIYCECGWNEDSSGNEKLPQIEEIYQQLELKLQEMVLNNEHLDVITFAGNGEPTMHPGFPKIIEDTLYLRDKYFPDVKVAVLSNATLIYKPEVFNALLKVDQNILKLDSAFQETCRLLNNPVTNLPFDHIIESLKKFEGRLIIQTMFVRGNYNDIEFDNSTDHEVEAWLKIINEVRPRQVMIYTIARDTPAQGLKKVSGTRLKDIAKKVEKNGFLVSVSE